jgi:hypothetical protein
MRRFLLSSAIALATLVLASADARAQDTPAPPPPMDPNAPGSPAAPTTTQEAAQKEELDRAEREDSGRKFELLWLDGSIGGSYIDMRQISASSFAVEKSSAGGPAFSLGAGLRFVVLVVGVRARYNALSSFNMWQLNGELGLKFPIKSFDLLIGGHGGYSFVGRLGDAALATNTSTPTNADAVKIRGVNAGLDLALDYYVSPTFSIGVGGVADVLFLSRPPADLPAGFSQLPQAQQDQIKNDPLYQATGSSIGLELAGGLRLGLHFGL